MIKYTRKRRAAGTVAVAVALVCGTCGLPSAIASAQSPCAGQNPYGFDESQRRQCGDQAFPLESVEPLPGGGNAYRYDVEGVQTTYLVPPPSFDAATADNAELEEYGIPTAPAETSREYPQWHKMITHMTSSPLPSAYTITVPEGNQGDMPSPSASGAPASSASGANGIEGSENWSGYDNYDSQQFYKLATAYYSEPKEHTTLCSPNSAVFWAGLGGVNNRNRLAQDGTGIKFSLQQHQAWSEVLPEQTSIQAVNPSFFATAEEEFEAQVEYISQTKFRMYLYNFRTGEHRSFNAEVKRESWDGSTAEFIAERPTYETKELWGRERDLPGLTNFETMWFEGYSNKEPLTKYGHNEMIMKESYLDSNTLAEPESIIGSAFFYDRHKHCN